MERLLVVGDGPVSEALVPMAGLLGLHVTLVADREAAVAGVADADSVIVTSHHDDVDGPALQAALSAGTPYIGAMGSRRTQARRAEWLTAQGVPDAEQTRIHGPAGLDIGADSPGEIALSILAELVASHRGVTGAGSIKDRPGPIHPELPPGTATCPTG